LWLDKEKKQIGRAEYPKIIRNSTKDGWFIIQQTYKTPEQVVHAKIELIYRWDGDGQVNFGETILEEVPPQPKRLIKLASIHYRPKNSRSPLENLENFSQYINDAGNKGADIVCLPEGITVVGTGKKYIEVSENVPGRSTKFLGNLAKKHNMYIVAGIYEKEQEVVYNTAILLDREGNLAGKYRKVCLPREEIEGGITPGNSFPVFDTDFGRIGMMICWDVAFPEPARMLSLAGAEVIFMPIWGGNLTLTRARAIENQIFLVTSTYGMKTAVFDQEGEILAEGSEENPVIVVNVDLNKQKLWPWLGDFKNRIPREMPAKETLTFYQ
jgi:predicted amidohydrolase